MNKKWYLLLILLAVYSLNLGVRIYWLSQKNGFHVDEGMTIALSCYKDYIISKNYEYDREYSGKELKEISLVGNETFKGAFEDIKNLWKDNRDPPHTNLYYSLFRISLLGLNTTEIKPVVFRGGLLNLIFFTISFIFFFLLIKTLFPDSWLIQYSVVLCAFLSAAAISNTLFLRPYQIQETMFIVLCYYFIKTIDLKKNIFIKENVFAGKPLFLLPVFIGITLLTGYYAVIFVCLLGLYVIFIKCKEKKYLEIVFYFSVFAVGILIAFILYPKYFDGFTSYRGTETIRTISANVSVNLTNSITASFELIYRHLFNILAIIICIASTVYIIICRQKIIVNKHAVFIFIASLLYIIITLILAPYKILRYGMALYPFLLILPAILLSSVIAKSRKIGIIAAALLCLSFLPAASTGKTIENIFKEKPDEYIFTKEKDIPVYIYMYYHEDWNYVGTWKYANLIPYLNDEQTYYFIKYFNDIYSAEHKEFYLVIENFRGLGNLDFSRFDILEEIKLTGGEVETDSIMGFYYLCKKVRLKSE